MKVFTTCVVSLCLKPQFVCYSYPMIKFLIIRNIFFFRNIPNETRPKFIIHACAKVQFKVQSWSTAVSHLSYLLSWHNTGMFLRPRLHGSGQIVARTKTCTVPPCVRLHGTGENGRIFEPLSVQVWDLKKAGQLFDRHGSIFRTDSCKHPNRATFCSDSAVLAWNQMLRPV